MHKRLVINLPQQHDHHMNNQISTQYKLAACALQFEDVASAAVEILIRGERPTVTALRNQIGRGSPNTILPLLNAWYSELGQRLANDTTLADPVRRHRGHAPPSSVWELGETRSVCVAGILQTVGRTG
jgi:hypothetical protein